MTAATYFFIISGIAFAVSALVLLVVAIRSAPDGATMLVLSERRRQIEKEGFTSAHDDEHPAGQLAAAAACYAMPLDVRREKVLGRHHKFTLVDCVWPWASTYWRPTPDNRLGELAKAGALILAEIERELRKRDSRDLEGGAL